MPSITLRSTAPCTFYAAGRCRHGDECKFAHVPSSAPSPPPPPAAPTSAMAPAASPMHSRPRGPAPCKFFLQGACRLGRECRFSHDLGPEDMAKLVVTTSAGEQKVAAGSFRVPCKFYNTTGCSIGRTCPYLHVDPKEKPEPKPKPAVGSGVKMHVLRAKPKAGAATAAETTTQAEGETTKQDGEEGAEDDDDDAEDKGAQMSDFLTKEEELYYYGAPGEYTLDEPSPMDGRPSYASVARKNVDEADAGDVQEDLIHVAAAAPKPCTYFLQGNCRYGDSCFYSHTLETKAMTAYDLEVAQAEIEESRNLECGICYDNIMDRGERFGLLSGCNHPFCLSCLRNWRGTSGQAKETLRQCPVCREETFFIIPSNRMVTNSERKRMLIREYRANLASIPCRHFNEGRGQCPFGSSCMYMHRYANGAEEDREVRTAVDAEGHHDVLRQVRLAHFFANLEPSQ